MSIHTSTIKILEDIERCDAIVTALLLDYNKEYIKRHFRISRQQLNHIIKTKLKNENERLRACEPDAVQE